MGKVLLIFEVADRLDSPMILSGLLGGGAFRNNRPLVLLLHLLLQPPGSERQLLFHHPVFWSFCGSATEVLEEWIVKRADSYLEQCQQADYKTLDQVLRAVLSDANLRLSEDDGDLV